jgi:hypothetical protein
MKSCINCAIIILMVVADTKAPYLTAAFAFSIPMIRKKAPHAIDVGQLNISISKIEQAQLSGSGIGV